MGACACDLGLPPRKDNGLASFGAGVSSVRRFRVGVMTWNGLISISWLGLAIWRTVEYRSLRYVIVVLLGVAYAASTARLLGTDLKPTPSLIGTPEVSAP